MKNLPPSFWAKLQSWPALVIFALAIAALYFPVSGVPGKTPDSFAYLKAAASFFHDFEFGADYISWPPLYPVVLAPFAGVHLEALNYLLFTIFILCPLLIFRAVGCGPILMILMGLAIAHSSPAQFVFPRIWSETLFLPLSLWELFSWSRYLAGGEWKDLALACIASMFCLLTRHMGICITGAMVATLMLSAGQRSLRQTLQALVAMVAATIPYILWLVRTHMLSQTLTGPRPPQPQSFATVLSGLSATLSHWLYPGVYLRGADLLSIVGCMVILASVCVIGSYVLHRIVRLEPRNGHNHADYLAGTSAIFIVGYLAVLLWVTHKTFIDMPGDRYLAPLFVPVTALFLYGFIRSQAWLRERFTYLLSVLRISGLIWILGEMTLP